MIMTAFLPVYLSTKKRLGREGSTRYASNLLFIVTLLMGIVTVVSFVLATPIIWTQSFSAHADFDSGLSIYLFRFFVIEVVLYALSSIISGILNAERDYLWSNAAPIFNNAGDNGGDQVRDALVDRQLCSSFAKTFCVNFSASS